MRRFAALRFVAPALLVAVACVQVALAQARALAPWLGGGFGMFSTTDTWSRRHLHAYALHAGVRRELFPPLDADRDVLRALAFPSDRALVALAGKLAPFAAADDGALEAIELQVWGTRYGPGLEPSGVLLRGVRFRRREWEE